MSAISVLFSTYFIAYLILSLSGSFCIRNKESGDTSRLSRIFCCVDLVAVAVKMANFKFPERSDRSSCILEYHNLNSLYFLSFIPLSKQKEKEILAIKKRQLQKVDNVLLVHTDSYFVHACVLLPSPFVITRSKVSIM